MYHAWLAKRVPNEDGANCVVKWCTMSLKATLGDHNWAREVSVPMCTNTQRILTGAEIKIWAKKGESESPEQKEVKVQTWRDNAMKQQREIAKKLSAR